MPAKNWDAHRSRLAAFAGNPAPLARSIAAALSRIADLDREAAELRRQAADERERTRLRSSQPEGLEARR